MPTKPKNTGKKPKKRDVTDEFIFAVSHQLRNPVTGIKWAAEVLMRDEKLTPERQKYYISLINTTAKSLGDLISLMLHVSRIERGKMVFSPRSMDVAVFVKNMLKEYAPFLAKKSISLVYKDDPKTLPIVMDSGAIYNIVQSLVSNAIAYTPEKGRITVAVAKKQDTFLLTIEDTGMGIPKKDQKTIFEKFTRGSNAKKIRQGGFGLGLYTAAETVRLLRGKIWFDSPAKNEKGTKFYIELPLQISEKI